MFSRTSSRVFTPALRRSPSSSLPVLLQVIQRYYVQFLSGYDAYVLSDIIQGIHSCPEEESVILSATCNAISNLAPEDLGKMGTSDGSCFDFRGVRLDWCRLQAYMSCAKSPLKLFQNPRLACLMNTIVFHTKMVDFLDHMLTETSDLSIFCFHSGSLLFQNWFEITLDQTFGQMRYLIAYPFICADFSNACHELCPEERLPLRDRALTHCNNFLDAMAKRVKELVTQCAEKHCLLADSLLPKRCAHLLAETIEARKRAEKKAAKTGEKALLRPAIALPGEESLFRSRETLPPDFRLHGALGSLCSAIAYTSKLTVWEHIFSPQEYLTQHLESRFNKTVKGMVMYNPEKSEIAKPSELLSSIRAFMAVLQEVENYVNLDMSRIFNSVLLQQSQSVDSTGDETITISYTKWYLDVLLRRVSSSHVLFSEQQMCFLLQDGMENAMHFNPQEYTDFMELASLAELIGPYGVKFMCERLVWHIASQIGEVKKLVIGHKEILQKMRNSFDKPETMKELTRELWSASMLGPGGPRGSESCDSLLQRLTIIGEILSFRNLIQDALHHVLAERIPFLLGTIEDLQKRLPANHPEIMAINELSSAAGLKTNFDATLVNAIRGRPDEKGSSVSPEEDYLHSCLLMVFIAEVLPKLAYQPQSKFKASICAHSNNVHCVPLAITELSAALFEHHGRGDIEDRMQEFLALASGSLLRLGQGSIDRAQQPNTESVYILLDQLVESSPHLGIDELQSCFPYVLLRSSFHCVYKQETYETSTA